jgi:hypothetical protein
VTWALASANYSSARDIELQPLRKIEGKYLHALIATTSNPSSFINVGLVHDVDVDAKDKPCCHPSAKLIFIELLVNKPEKGLDPTV